MKPSRRFKVKLEDIYSNREDLKSVKKYEEVSDNDEDEMEEEID